MTCSPQMMLEWVEVTIAMKQLMIFAQAESRDDRIDGRSHSNAFSTQEAIIPGRRNCDLVTTDVAKLKRIKALEDPSNVEFGAKALQDLGKDQIAYQQLPRTHQLIGQIGFAALHAVEVIDPD